MSLNVAEVRSALHILRSEWYEKLSPEHPFLISNPAISLPASSSHELTIGQFACMFDYSQHLKRRQRITYTQQVSLH